MANLFGPQKNKKEEVGEEELPPTPAQSVSPEMKEFRKREFVWRAYDSNSKEKSGDWYFILWTIALAGAVGAFLLENVLFALFLIIAAFSLSIYASRKPRIVTFRITRKGMLVDTLFIPFSEVSHFYITDEPGQSFLLLQSTKLLSPLHVFPISDEIDTDDLHAFLINFLKEKFLEIPPYERIMDRIGF